MNFLRRMNMKSRRFVVFVVVMSLATVAFAQSGAHKMAEPKALAPKSDAQVSFDTMKTLAGTWLGPVTLDPPQPEMSDGKPLQVTMRVTSRGHVLVHEMQEAGTPLDPAKYDHPVTMLYVDAERLTLVHYCDAGNRPRMTGKISPDGKTLEFDFADLSGSNKYGHMYHSVFTLIDANHHTEDWTYMMPGDKPVHAHFDLQRTK
jgi:hypothetical protein